MEELKGFYNLLIRGQGLSKTEKKYLNDIYTRLGKEKLYDIIREKKILPFAARTFILYGFDEKYWTNCLDLYRERNQKILNCLKKVYEALDKFEVKKMFVSENFAALLYSGDDLALFSSGDVDNYADPKEKEKIYKAFEFLGYSRKERFSGRHQIAAEFYPPESEDILKDFYISVDFYPLARLKLPCFIEADKFVQWDKLIKYNGTKITLPPKEALMYICILHISLHSFSRAPDIRLYIDLLNMAKVEIEYNKITNWCINDNTYVRTAVACDLSNMLMKTNIPKDIAALSSDGIKTKSAEKIKKMVYDPANNDLIYNPTSVKVLKIEMLCNDAGAIKGLKDILFPDKNWMKNVYGNSGIIAHIRHIGKVI